MRLDLSSLETREIVHFLYLKVTRGSSVSQLNPSTPEFPHLKSEGRIRLFLIFLSALTLSDSTILPRLVNVRQHRRQQRQPREQDLWWCDISGPLTVCFPVHGTFLKDAVTESVNVFTSAVLPPPLFTPLAQLGPEACKPVLSS